MKILVLGGTQFVGRHIVEAMVDAGHTVSIFNRGRSPDGLPIGVERIRGDRDLGAPGLEALSGRRWDACIDVSGYTASQVRCSAEKLHASVGRYVFISAVSVYGDPAQEPVDETSPRLPPAGEDVTEVNGETYGALKVACENIVREIYRDRCALLRPQVVAGPWDPLDRFSYWVRRAGQTGEMPAPGDGSDFLQFLDARDLARFTRTVSENVLSGCYNVAGPRLTWAEFMAVLDARNLLWVPAGIIAAEGLTEFELPLYRRAGSPRSSLMNVSNARAVDAGLTLTDPSITARDVRTWIRGQGLVPALSPDREAALIRRLRATRD